jgi:hypothetical protein
MPVRTAVSMYSQAELEDAQVNTIAQVIPYTNLSTSTLSRTQTLTSELKNGEYTGQ